MVGLGDKRAFVDYCPKFGLFFVKFFAQILHKFGCANPACLSVKVSIDFFFH